MLDYGREGTSDRKQERERGMERESMATSSYSSITFRNQSHLSKTNFAMIALEMGEQSKMRTIRTT